VTSRGQKGPPDVTKNVHEKSPQKCPRKVTQLGDISWTKMSTRCHQKCPRKVTLKKCPRNVTHFDKKCPRNVIVHEMSPSRLFQPLRLLILQLLHPLHVYSNLHSY
jgi:hypothetical protein